MSMSKKDFIALADALRAGINDESVTIRQPDGLYIHVDCLLNDILNFCRTQNPNFKADRWMDYLAGRCGPNGGKPKA